VQWTTESDGSGGAQDDLMPAVRENFQAQLAQDGAAELVIR
jgi:hypothetical protein